MVCFRYVIVNTLHKVDNQDDDNDDDDNNKDTGMWFIKKPRRF
jgi:hypothetical protein